MCFKSELVPIPQFLFDRGGVKMREDFTDSGIDSDWGFDPTHPEYGINELGEKCFRLDQCIIPAVKALWDAGIVTISCCCGHDTKTGEGVISILRPNESMN